MKTEEEYRNEILNYIAVREWYRQRVLDHVATDGDLRKLEHCRDLAVKAREAGITKPPFD